MPSLDALRRLITAHAPGAGLDGITLSAVAGPTAPMLSTSRPRLAVVAQGAKRAILHDRTYDYAAGQFLVVTIDAPITGYVTEAPFLGFGMELRPSVIASILLDADLPRSVGTPPGMAVSDADDDLLDAVVRLVRLAERPGDLRILGPMLEREVLWRLLTGAQGATVAQIGLADSNLTHVSRAIRWIRDHYAEALRVNDLARLSGMSVSSFHRHFRAITAMTPIQFQKRIRLQQARALLAASAGDVTSVGFVVGYDSPSQFSREYRRLFGAPPGQDAAHLRTTAPDAPLPIP
ncbi:AraC family transcriptional regulator [Cryptosporangium phraense]|uniref:AraC family transcriptional regulator n=1 Tax=Cryptosporangium phraense TaxID=2593070 RepID=A0A545AUY0_9ACTN|nr:AraC family transcriptional regulator [Cryptosporangium phraense]TQS44395.1 AraC family transcriptional regulator [Cryptosporangium phraense]